MIERCKECGLLSKAHCEVDNCPYKHEDDGPSGTLDLTGITAEPETVEFLESMPPEDLFAEPAAKLEPVYGREPVKLTTKDGKVITLNEQQTEALEMISLWQDDRDDLYFRLSGYAGTGKTTISKLSINRWANRHGGVHAVVVSAPTHKAKKQIADATGMEAATLQSLLGLAPNTDLADFNINKPEFSAKKKATIEYYKLVILDEGSMVNKDLWEMLKLQARRFNVKILTMLDDAQLPPVKEETPYIMIDPDIKYQYQLTKVERQAGDNPLMPIYDKIRNDIHAQLPTFHKITELVDGDYGPLGAVFYDDIRKFGPEVVDAFRSQEFAADKNHCKVICWTNARIQFWNGSIRKTLLNDLKATNPPAEVLLHAQVIMPEELLMSYASYTDGLQNSGEYEVVQWQYDEKPVWYGDKKSLTTMMRGYRVALRDVDQGTILNTFIIDPEPAAEAEFVRVFNDYLFRAKSYKQWPAYFAFKAENLLMRDLKDVRGALICKKDLDYAYAITVHKSQGSTFDQVFVDLKDIENNKNPTERNKLTYVAFSRPRYLATILTGG